MGMSGLPEVGEEYEQINGSLADHLVRKHHREGFVLKVAAINHENVTFDGCVCGRPVGGCTWTWSSYKSYFRKINRVITLEESRRAKDLPPIEDVLKFFKDREAYLRDKARQDFVTALNNIVQSRMTDLVTVLDQVVKREER